MICPYSLAVWGGVQSQVLGLSRQLRSKGVAVQVLAPCDGPPPEPWVTPLGNSIPYAQNGSLAPLAPDPPAQLRVLGAIRDERFDLLHLHEPLAPGSTLTTLVVKPVPLIGTFHASGKITAYKYGRPLVRRLANRLDLRVAVSPEAAGMAQHHLGGTYETLFNGIEMDRFCEVPKQDLGAPSILFLGRHEPRKGLSVLLEAMQFLPAETQLFIGGHGPETERLQQAYSHDGRLRWLGSLSEDDKLRYLRSVDVFCASSLGGESFGVVLLEGMAAETPVVASDLPAYRVVARDGLDATLFAAGDTSALAKALLDVFAGGASVQARMDSGNVRARQFSMSKLADAYIAHYERLITRA